MYKKNMEF